MILYFMQHFWRSLRIIHYTTKCSALVPLACLSCVQRFRISLYYFFVRDWMQNPKFNKDNILFICFEDYVTKPTAYINDVILPFLKLGKLRKRLTYTRHTSILGVVNFLQITMELILPCIHTLVHTIHVLWNISSKVLCKVYIDLYVRFIQNSWR